MFRLMLQQDIQEHLIQQQGNEVIVKYKDYRIRRRRQNKIQSIKEECSDGYVN